MHHRCCCHFRHRGYGHGHGHGCCHVVVVQCCCHRHRECDEEKKQDCHPERKPRPKDCRDLSRQEKIQRLEEMLARLKGEAGEDEA
ncbi:MAG: hypothetical protein AB1445_11085 [Bacillota bacterium]